MENRYAGFWIRLLASLLDGLIIMAAGVVIMGITGVPMKNIFDFLNLELEGFEWQQFLYVLLSIAYAVVLPATSLQGTLGKSLLGLKIIDKEGERISIMRSIGRVLSQIVSAIILYIGYIMIAFHPQKRGLHDIMAGTFVVKKK